MKVSFLTRTALAVAVFFFAVNVAFAQSATGETRRAAQASPTTDRRMAACLAREKAVTNRMTSLVRFTNNMLEKFNAISLRVQQFYTEKVIPTGKTVPNYDALLTEISSKKTVVMTKLTDAQAAVDAFSCEDGDIRTQYATFRQNMQAIKQALHDYRTAIRNLIQAVHSVVEDEEATPSPSPSPTPSPETQE